MWFESIKASRPTAKSLFDGVLVVFLVTIVVCGAAVLPEERYRRSLAMETSSPTQISSSNKRHLATSVLIDLEIPTAPSDLIFKLENFDEIIDAAGPNINKMKVLHGKAAIALPDWHNELLGSYSSKRSDDIVLYNMLQHLNDEDKVAWVLIQGRYNAKGAKLRNLCTSLLGRLSLRKIRADLIVGIRFDQYGLNRLKLDTLFNNPSIELWERFVNNYWSEKSGKAIGSFEVQDAAYDSMLSVLTDEYGVPGLAEYISVEFPPAANFLSRRLYKEQLYIWAEPSVNLRDREIADVLEIDKWTTSSDSARLSVWLDYVAVSIMRDNVDNLSRELILIRFRATFDTKITTKFEQTHFDYPYRVPALWTSALIDWQFRLRNQDLLNAKAAMLKNEHLLHRVGLK